MEDASGQARLSVIIPTYNRARALRRALASVLPQLSVDDEVLIIDDQSTDETSELVRGVKDARIRYMSTTCREGPAKARNMGIHAANSEVLVFLDSDDEWMPGRLSLTYDAFELRPEAVAIACGCECPQDESRSYGRAHGEMTPIDLGPWIPWRVPGASCWMVRRDTAMSVGGFSEDLSRFEDWEFIIKLAKKGQVLWLPARLVRYHKSADSLLADEAGYAASLQRILVRHSEVIRPSAMAYSHYANLLGQTLCKEGSAKAARRWFKHAWSARPGHPRSVLNWLVSWAGRRAFVAYVNLARSVRARTAGAFEPDSRTHG
nr:glycosyltransferase family 2 protein [Oceanococcus sp. HetDA_MAG_MS8]